MNPYEINPRARRAFKQTEPINKQDMFQEVSWSQSDVERAFIAYGQNPDPIVRTKGLRIYKEMMEDDQVKSCVELRKQARLSTNWIIVPGKEGDAQSEKMAEFIKYVLEALPGPFQDTLYEIYSAIEYGFSVSELIYKVIDDGLFSGLVGLESIKTREPFYYDFKCDDHGNLMGLVYSGSSSTLLLDSRQRREGKPEIGTLNNPFNPDKFIIYSYNSQFGNPYGRSDLLSAFRSWWSKKIVMRFWNIWLERYASPFVHAQIKQGSLNNQKVLDEVDNFLKNLSARGSFRSTDNVVLTPIMFSPGAGDSYEKSIEAHNRYISHSLLMPNLIGMTGSQGSGQSTGGSYALGKKHFEAFMWVLDKMGRDTADAIVGDQIINRLIEINFPNVPDELYPRFQYEEIDDESLETRSRILTMLASGGFIDINEEWVREFLTIPKRDLGAAPLPTPEEKAVQVAAGSEQAKTDAANTATKEPATTTAINKKEETFQERAVTSFEKKTLVRDLERDIDSVQDSLFNEASDTLRVIMESLISYIDKKKIIQSSDVREVDNVKVTIGPFGKVIHKWMVKIHLDSKLRAFEELGRGGIDIELTRNFASAQSGMEPWEPVPPQDAVDFFNRKVKARVVDKNGKKVLVELASRKELQYYDAKAFAVAGIVRDDILGDVKQVLLNGIKRQDYAGALGDLKSVFNKYLALGVTVDDELLSPHRLQTIVNTNVVEAINNGRRAMYEDPDIKGFVQYWQYSAVLDARTTDYCACMDNKVFRIEDMPMLMPPAHFNCRSFTVPITQFEVEEMVARGRGVEISQPCLDRASAFSHKEFYIGYDPLPLFPGSLENFMPSCPYSTCRSSNTIEVSNKFNLTEFRCNSCNLPFRITTMGDLYLYDSGKETWDRATRGQTPSYYTVVQAEPIRPIIPPDGTAPVAEKAPDTIDDQFRQSMAMIVSRCPYKHCHHSEIRLNKKIFNVGEFICDWCHLPFRVSDVGDVYLFDAGTDVWYKVTSGVGPSFFQKKDEK